MRRTLILVAVATAVAGQVQARDYISIVGSSTVYPFATVVAEQFGKTTDFKTPKIEPHVVAGHEDAARGAGRAGPGGRRKGHSGRTRGHRARQRVPGRPAPPVHVHLWKMLALSLTPST